MTLHRILSFRPPKTPFPRSFSSRPNKSSLYDVLGVSVDADPSRIKEAFFALCKEHHPDKNPEGGEAFRALAAAYEVLSNPETRRKYDEELGVNRRRRNMKTGTRYRERNWDIYYVSKQKSTY